MDYHQEFVQVCVEGADGRVLANRRCANDIAEIVDAAERCGEVAGAAIESCSGAADLAEELVTRAGWPVDLAHPGFVGRMKQNPDKTDFSDAHLLADLERVGYLPKVWLPPQEVRELRRLVNYRQQLVKERTAIKLRIRSLLRDQRVRPPFTRAWTCSWTKWVLANKEVSEQSRWILTHHFRRLETLRKDIREVEKRADRQTAKDPVVLGATGQEDASRRKTGLANCGGRGQSLGPLAVPSDATMQARSLRIGDERSVKNGKREIRCS
jgi:transposase